MGRAVNNAFAKGGEGAVVLALVGGFILKMGPDGVMPFIYFQF